MEPRATWKELCVDTGGGDRLGRFWAPVLGLEMVPGSPDGDLCGETESQGVAMCPVPEPKTVKDRVHIDVYADSLEDLTDLGATVVRPAAESGLPWSVLADPEGNELCAFLHRVSPAPDYRFFQLVADAVDADAIARWWADVFGATVTRHDEEHWRSVVGVPGLPFERITFGEVPEPKTVKNRIHWDVYAEAEPLLEAGASLLRRRDNEIGWDVLADPEGNEFCVFSAG